MPKKQKSGLYRAKIKVGVYPNGRPLYKYASGRTIRELEAHKAELRRSFVGDGIEIMRDMLVCDGIERWYSVTKRGDLSASARRNLELAINTYINPVIGQKRMRAVTQQDLVQLLRGLAKIRGKTIVGDVFGVLTGTFAWASGNRIIDYNPCAGLRRPVMESKSRREFTDAETRAVLQLIDMTSDRADKLLLMALYYLGLRRGEALGLQWHDFDFDAKTVHILRDIDYSENGHGEVGKLKSQSSNRVIPVPDPFLQELLKLPGIRDAYVIQAPNTHTHWAQSTYVRRWRGLMAQLYALAPAIEHKDLAFSTGQKNPKGEKLPPRSITISVLTAHYFRHNYASLLYEAGVDVLTAQRYLGHSDPQTTMRIYTHLRNRREHSQRKKVGNIFAAERKRATSLQPASRT